MVRVKVFDSVTSIPRNIDDYKTFVEARADKIKIISVNTLGNNIILTYMYKKEM